MKRILFFLLLVFYITTILTQSAAVAEEKIVIDTNYSYFYYVNDDEVNIKLCKCFGRGTEEKAVFTHKDGYTFIEISDDDEGFTFHDCFVVKDSERRIVFSFDVNEQGDFFGYCGKQLDNFLKKNKIVANQKLGNYSGETGTFYAGEDHFIKYAANFYWEDKNFSQYVQQKIFYYQIIFVEYDLKTGKKKLTKILSGKIVDRGSLDIIREILKARK